MSVRYLVNVFMSDSVVCLYGGLLGVCMSFCRVHVCQFVVLYVGVLAGCITLLGVCKSNW